MSDPKLVKVLQIINSQGLGQSVIFRPSHIAELTDTPLDFILDDVKENRITIKKLGSSPMAWRVTTSAFLEYLLAYRVGGG